MEEEPPVERRVMAGGVSVATWGTRASHDAIIIHRHAPATLLHTVITLFARIAVENTGPSITWVMLASTCTAGAPFGQ